MSWLYVPGMEDSRCPSDSPESITEPYVLLSGTPTQRPLSWRGWKMRPWIERLSGLTSTPSTLRRGLDEWISSLPASPASRSRPRDSSVALSMTVGSGRGSPESSVTWDPDSSSWKTSPSSSSTDSPTSSPTLPRWGSMRNGVCSPQPPLAPPTSGKDSGSWPTPTSTDHKASGHQAGDSTTKRTTLTDQAVRMWGTPVARDDQKSPEAHMAMKQRMPGGPRSEATSLTVQVKMWPTPRASEGTRGSDGPHGDGGLSLKATVSHQDPTMRTDGSGGRPKADLNPRFVAALMGVPWDWLTPCTSVETDSFRSWLRTHSPSWRIVLELEGSWSDD